MRDGILYGFDSSLTHFGYAVWSWQRGFVAAGCITTKVTDKKKRRKLGITKTEDNRARVEGIGHALRRLVEKHGAPEAVCVEALAIPFRSSKVAIQALGRVRGLVDALVVEHDVETHEFSPQALKVATHGTTSAEKHEVEIALRRVHPSLGELLDQLDESSREHAADAAAAIHARLTQSNSSTNTEG